MNDYRPEVDTLRAIAVLLVLLYHFDIPPFSGGFVGVDIFFVISGFLITRIINTEIREKRFSIGQFYARRIRRILPALIVVILISLVVAFFIFLPIDFNRFIWSGISALFSLSNIYFWRHAGYFDTRSELKPLLHTWSLGVEEQVYFVLPILIWFLARYLPRYSGIILALIAVLSLGLAVFGIATAREAIVFYLMPTRIWELLAGGLLATFTVPSMPRRLIIPILVLGVMLIFVPAITYNAQTPFPGIAAVPPILGAVLIIWAGHGAYKIAPILSWKPLLFIGLISYSLYLWHWPLLAFARYYSITPLSYEIKIALLLCSFGLAILSWRFIERPMRYGKGRVTLILGVFIVCIVALTVCMGLNTTLQRFPQEAVRIAAADGTTWKCKVADTVPFGHYRGCSIATEERDPSKVELVFWGDSHAQMLVPALEAVVSENKQSAILVALDGCAPIVGANKRRECISVNSKNIETIEKSSNVKTIILGLYWQHYLNGLVTESNEPTDLDIFNAIESVVIRLTEKGKSVILIGPTAVPNYNVANEWARSIALNRPLDKPRSQSRARFDKDAAVINAFLKRIEQKPGVKIIYPADALCTQHSCPYIVDGEALHSDHNHLTQKWAGRLTPLFRQALENFD